MIKFSDSSFQNELFTQNHFIKGTQIICKPYSKQRNHLQNNSFVLNPKISQTNIIYDDSSGERNDKKLFIGGIHRLVVEQEMLDYFSKFGQVKECLLMRDKYTGKSRGISF